MTFHHNYRAVARSENPGGLVVMGGDNVPPLVEIGLTDLPKTAKAPPAPRWRQPWIRFAVIVLVPNALMNLLCLVKTILCSLLSTMDLLSWFYSVPFSYFLIWKYKVVCKWKYEIFWTFESGCHAFLIGKGVLGSSSDLRKNKINIFFHYNPNILWQD